MCDRAAPRLRRAAAPRISSAVAAALLAVVIPALGNASDGDAAHGAVVFAMASGCSCHTAPAGPVAAGGVEIKTPFGTFYSTNITPDPDTGIGRWSDAEIAAAIRTGDLPDHRVEAPVMPYFEYAGMADRDVQDLVAYLRTLAPARRDNRPPAVRLPFPRLAYRAWRLLFAPRAETLAAAPADPIQRGRYLVDHVALCPDCHTPRTRFGGLDASLYLAGTPSGPDGNPVPNITPDRETGIGGWSEDAVVALLRTGMKPDMDNVQGFMADMVNGVDGGPGYARAPEAELRSIAKYLRTVPPIRHQVDAE